MPGTVIEISDSIVRKDMSFMEPQRKFIEVEVMNFKYKFAGITAKPSTKLSLSNALPQIPLKLIYGGIYPLVNSLLFMHYGLCLLLFKNLLN
jgi:hypothetical protein